MKRRLRLASLFLVLGAVSTVGVAWAFAALSNIVDTEPADFSGHVDLGGARWLLWRVSEPGSRALVGIGIVTDEDRRNWPVTSSYPWADRIAIDRVPRWSRMRQPPHPMTPSDRQQVVIEVTRGWPMRALWSRIDGTLDGDVILQDPVAVGGVHVGRFSGSLAALRVLPYGPVWPGLAVDTIFDAALLWLGWLALRAAWHRIFRVRVRIARGLCPACGYPMGQSAVCTECGEALPVRPAHP